MAVLSIQSKGKIMSHLLPEMKRYPLEIQKRRKKAA
jgi:hypothetical protein